MSSDDTRSQNDAVESAQGLANDVADLVKKSAGSTQQALDDGIAVASDAVKSGAAKARAEYGKAYERSQVRTDGMPGSVDILLASHYAIVCAIASYDC